MLVTSDTMSMYPFSWKFESQNLTPEASALGRIVEMVPYYSILWKKVVFSDCALPRKTILQAVPGLYLDSVPTAAPVATCSPVLFVPPDLLSFTSLLQLNSHPAACPCGQQPAVMQPLPLLCSLAQSVVINTDTFASLFISQLWLPQPL